MAKFSAIEINVVAVNEASRVLKRIEGDASALVKKFTALDAAMDKAMDVEAGGLRTDLDEANTYLRQLVENTEDTNRELDKMSAKLDGLSGKTKTVSKETKKVDSSWKGVTRTLRNVRSLLTGFAAAFGLQQVIQMGAELMKVGAKADAVAVSYRSLANSVGSSNEIMMASLRQVSQGTIKDTTLMETANAIMLSTGAEGLAQLPKLLEIARASALATGKSFDYVFKTLVDGVSRGEPRLIDNANIYIKIGDAVEAYAKSVGKTVDELDDLDRRMATLNAVMGEAPEILAKFDGAMSQAELNVNRFSVAMTNLKEQTGAALAESAGGAWAGDAAQWATASIAANRYALSIQDTLNVLGKYQRESKNVSDADKKFIQDAYDASRAIAQSSMSIQKKREELAKLDAELDSFVKEKDIEVTVIPVVEQGDIQQQFAKKTEIGFFVSEIDADEAIDKFEENLARRASVPSYVAAATAQYAAIELEKQLLKDAQAANLAADALNGLFNNPSTISSRVEAAAGNLTSQLYDLVIEGDISAKEYVANVNKIEDSAQSLWLRIRNMSEAEADAQIAIWAKFFGVMVEGFDKIEEAAAKTFDELFGETDKWGDLESAISSTKSSLLGFVKDGSLASSKYEVALNEMRDSAARVFKDIEGMDDDAAAAYVAAWEGSWDRYLEGLYKVEKATSKSTKSITADIQKALFSRREVTDEDMALSAAGKYQEAPLENARRLDAIMARGFEELKAHPDWAAILRIPPEILAGSEADLKAWAAETNKLVSAGASVEDVNWDAFLKEYEANLKIAEGKAKVEARAIQELLNAGYATSAGDAKKKYDEMTGAAKPVKLEPEFSSESVSTSFSTAFADVDFGTIISDSMSATLGKKEDAIKNKGKLAGVWFGEGFNDGVEMGLTGLVASIVAGLVGSAEGSSYAPTGTIPFEE